MVIVHFTLSIELVISFSHLILCHPPLLLPPIPPSIRVCSNESTLRMRWPKDWSFSFSISPSNEHSGLISFRMDWLDLLAAQGPLKSLLQHHSSKASILQCSAFFTILSLYWYLKTCRFSFICRLFLLVKGLFSRYYGNENLYVQRILSAYLGHLIVKLEIV